MIKTLNADAQTLEEIGYFVSEGRMQEAALVIDKVLAKAGEGDRVVDVSSIHVLWSGKGLTGVPVSVEYKLFPKGSLGGSVMKGNQEGLRRYAHPGKFEGELHIAQYVYALVMEGWGDTAGSVPDYGQVYNALDMGEEALKRIEEIAKEEGDALTPAERNLILKSAGAIMSEGEQGFVGVEFHETKAALDKAWDEIEAGIEEFDEELEKGAEMSGWQDDRVIGERHGKEFARSGLWKSIPKSWSWSGKIDPSATMEDLWAFGRDAAPFYSAMEKDFEFTGMSQAEEYGKAFASAFADAMDTMEWKRIMFGR